MLAKPYVDLLLYIHKPKSDGPKHSLQRILLMPIDSDSDEHQEENENDDPEDRVVLINETSDHTNECTDSVPITKPGTQNTVSTHHATPDQVV